MGDAISPADLLNGYGTLGGFLIDSSSKIYGLSNYHVLFLDETVNTSTIIQPPRMLLPKRKKTQKNQKPEKYKGVNDYSIGIVDFGLRGDTVIDQHQIGMDVAIFEIKGRRYIASPRYDDYSDEEYPELIDEVRQPVRDEVVYKFGARTGLTRATVSSFDMAIRDIPEYMFYNHIQKPTIYEKKKNPKKHEQNKSKRVMFNEFVLHNQVVFFGLLKLKRVSVFPETLDQLRLEKMAHQ